MKLALLGSLVLVSLSAHARDCSVSDYDDFQERPLSTQVRRILRRKGYVLVSRGTGALTAGESCTSEFDDDYCSLVVYDEKSGKLLTEAEHREGQGLGALHRELRRGRDYGKIKSCRKL